MLKKSLSITLLLALFCVFNLSCIHVQIKDDTSLSVIVEIAARRLGHSIAEKAPDKVPKLVDYCDTALSGDLSNALLDEGLGYLITHYASDPLLMDDLRSLCALFGVNLGDPVFDFDMGEKRLLSTAIKAFKRGLKL